VFKKIRNFKAREWFLSVLIMLILTDLTIFFNVPFLREAFTFLFFTVVPGILILQILKLNKISFLKKMLLWVGLSVGLMILIGLFLNSLYPMIIQPLSIIPVIISFNIVIVLLLIAAYKRSRENFNIEDVFNIKVESSGKLISPLIFSTIFPFLAIFGTYLMNTTQNNIILLLLLLLIPSYVLVIVYLKEKIYDSTYPFSIWMIGLSLLLIHGLTSNYIIGRDVHYEFYCFQLALDGFHWDLTEFYNPYNVCLSITILPVIFKVLSNINPQYVFKLFFGIIGSITPLIIYAVSKKYLGSKYAFFASLLFIFQLFFLDSLGNIKQLIATIFFFLIIMVIFDESIEKISKKVLILVFATLLVLSHYSTAYISLVFIVVILLVPFFKSIRDRKLKFTNFDIIVILFLIILGWYAIVAQVQLNAGADVIQSASQASSSVLETNTKDPLILAAFGIGLKSIPNAFSALVHDLVFIMIGIGLISIIWRYKEYLKRIDVGFFLGILISVALLALFVIVPNISLSYGPERLFYQVLIFLAPLFVIGVIKTAKILKKPEWSPAILALILISLFACSTFLIYHFAGIAQSPYYEKNGTLRNEYFIYDQEVVTTGWIKNYSINNSNINNSVISTDAIGYSRVLLGHNSARKIKSNFFFNETNNGYIYLGYFNENAGIIYESFDVQRGISNYFSLFKSRSKIYDNGGGEVFS